jgi:acetylglutamate kinase
MKMQQLLAKEPIFTFQTLETGTTTPFIERARRLEKVPVLVAPEQGLETALLELLPEIAMRVHFIRAAGGLKSQSGERLEYVYTHKANFQPLEELEFDFPNLGKKLMEERSGVHLSVTSPLNLLQEIFTVKGAGTLLRKGSEILYFQGLEGVDEERLLNLLEASFGKKLANQDFLKNVAPVYIESAYRGAVLLEEHPAGLYLSKFAVGREARGEGVALELWREVCRNHEALFWRSNASNPFNAWYHRQADGHHQTGKWQIYWRGVSADTISEIIAYCMNRPEDFSKPD